MPLSIPKILIKTIKLSILLRRTKLKVFCDAGTKNGGRICMVDPQKNKCIIKQRTGDLSNNQLEYLGLLYTISYVNNNYSRKNVIIYTDSLLVANQINGKWRITTEHLIPLWKKCNKYMTSNIQVTWVRREKNLAGIELDK
jgi:ribonuclease HI